MKPRNHHPTENTKPSSRKTFMVRRYDLAATLTSGQAFRWQWNHDAWEGMVASSWVRLRSVSAGIEAETIVSESDWSWLSHYLQIDHDLEAVLATFPDDEPLRAAVEACHGLRLLRQDPWECLASFILSSSKQIVQIQQIIACLCQKFGQPLPGPSTTAPAFAFPSPERIAQCSEAELRGCKMGFRAAYLRATARMIAEGGIDLSRLDGLELDEAREALMQLPGVGRKIADCVLLFALGYARAFPMDVWVIKALRTLYFHGRPAPERFLRRFAEEHFGPYGGYAQQYLYHYMRIFKRNRAEAAPAGGRGENGKEAVRQLNRAISV
ncbi:MAG: hypothetical protein M1608_07800 [Candidatus Omnitrophica bacterium]|nr:hypothetical protein [Candidatus Omnitrophota bacterium]